MGTQILAGSVGRYKPHSPEIFGETRFIVTQDTCVECERIPVRFLDVSHESWIDPSKICGWDEKRTEDY